MKNTIYKIGFLLLAFTIVISCESPEAETNYTEATSKYEYPAGITLASGIITTDSFEFNVSIDGDGKAYYVAVESGNDAPSNQDVFDGAADGLIESGSFDLTGAPVTVTISNLCNDASYDIYAVQMTSDNFLSPEPVKFSITTNTIDISGTYTANPFAFGEAATEYTATLALIDGTTNQYTIDSAWGPGFVAWVTGDSDYEGSFIYSGILTINTDNTITIVGDDFYSIIGGAGDYDSSCINTFSYTLDQELFSPFTVDVVLTQDQQ